MTTYAVNKATGMGMERKVFALKAAALDDNKMAGAASVMGTMDQGGDVLFPGFFEKALPDFRKNGFVPVGHKWDELPVCMPTLAEERGSQLYTESLFHSTQAAQDARTVCRERLDAGLTMGLSVGFSLTEDGEILFPNGQALYNYAKKSGCDLALFNKETILAWKWTCRAMLPGGCEKLYEYSITPAPMNVEAVLSEAKSRLQARAKTIETPRASTFARIGETSMRQGANLSADSATSTERRGKTIKSAYLGNIERTAGLSAVRAIHSALLSFVCSSLYDSDEDDTGALVEGLAPAYDEARDLSLKTLKTLLETVDIADLQDDLAYYTYYYSADPATQDAETFVQKAQRLATDVGAFVTLAARRQDTRVKAGRKLSGQTMERMQTIHDSLQEHCASLKALLDDAVPDPEPDDAEPSDTDTKHAKTVQDDAHNALCKALTEDMDSLFADPLFATL